MDLGFIINQLPHTTSTSEEVHIAKGKYKVLTKWSDLKREIAWQLKKK